MDRVLQQVNPERSRLLLVAAGCLILAAKYEEAEVRVCRCVSLVCACISVIPFPQESVPSADSVVAYLGHQYPREHLLEIEKHLLSRLSWSCTVVTPLHYLGIFAARVSGVFPR